MITQHMGGECKQKLSSVRGGGRNYYRKVTSIKETFFHYCPLSRLLTRTNAPSTIYFRHKSYFYFL